MPIKHKPQQARQNLIETIANKTASYLYDKISQDVKSRYSKNAHHIENSKIFNNNILSFNQYLKLFELMKKSLQIKKPKHGENQDETKNNNMIPQYYPTIELQQLQINENNKNTNGERLIRKIKPASEQENYRNYYHYNEHPFIDTRGNQVIFTSGELESIPSPSSMNLNLCFI
jgi:hypothetical protein